MRQNDSELEPLLGVLPQAQSDAARAERVRARCHRVLARAQAAPPHRRLIESALVGAFSLVYLCAVALFATAGW